jgi:indolepyruvate decarboxylase
VLDLGGVNLNHITTAAYSGQLDQSRFVTIGLDDVRIGEQVIPNVRLEDVLSEWPSSNHHRHRTRENRGSSRRWTAAHPTITMAALYPRYAAFLRGGDTVVVETGSSSLGVTPTIFPEDVRVEAQALWGSIGWATPAVFGVAFADPSRRTILIASTDCERRRRNGTVWSKCHRLRTQQ